MGPQDPTLNRMTLQCHTGIGLNLPRKHANQEHNREAK